MNTNLYALIMAGGVGSRFWPVSTTQFPKQFHDMLGNGKSLLQNTVNRFTQITNNSNILIATNDKYNELVKEQVPALKQDQIILEPAMRNTAPCILLSAFKIFKENPEGVMVVAPSDHWIEDEKEFLSNILEAYNYSQHKNILLTLGIKPDSPNTGYGYIKYEKNESNFKKVENFTEKPSLDKAIEFLESGAYLWNAGIFVWNVKSIIESFKQYLPEMYTLFYPFLSISKTEEELTFIEKNYHQAQSISIDFGIMEKAANVEVLPVDFGWNDLGTWGSLYNKLQKDENKNASLGGEFIFRGSKENIVRVDKRKKVVIQGLENFIVVEKDDILLICPKDKEQDIKEITAEVKHKFGENYT